MEGRGVRERRAGRVSREFRTPGPGPKPATWLRGDGDKWADSIGAVGQGDGLLDPRAAVDALDDPPGHLVLEEVDVLAGRHFQSHAVADDIEARIQERQVAGAAIGRNFFRDEDRAAEEIARNFLLGAA